MNKIKLGLLAVLATAYSSTTIYADPTLSSVKLTGIARTLDAPAIIQAGTPVWVKLTINSGINLRTEVFSNVHTNEFGQFSVNIGAGTPVETTKALNELVLNNDTKVLIEISYSGDVDSYKVIAERKYLDIVREMPASMDGVAKTDDNNTFTGNQIINGTLDVTGTTTFDSELVANSTLVIGSDANDVLTLKSLINGSLLPKFPGVPTIGSNDARWNSLNLGESGLSIGNSVKKVAIAFSADNNLLTIDKDIQLGSVDQAHLSPEVDLALSGDLDVRGTIYGNLNGTFSGTADKAKSLDGTTVGSIPYQAQDGATFLTEYIPNETGRVLVGGATKPEYASVSSVLLNQSASGMVLTGGSINGTPIGAGVSGMSTGAFTTLTATHLTIGNRLPKDQIAKDLEIDGGTIENTIIGADFPKAANFTDLTATGTLTLTNDLADDQVADNLTINGGTITNTPIGATPNTGVFTSLEAKSNVILGAANGTNTITVNGLMSANGSGGSIEANSVKLPFSIATDNESTLFSVINTQANVDEEPGVGIAASFKGSATKVAAVEIEHTTLGNNALKLVKGDLELAEGTALINNHQDNAKEALKIIQNNAGFYGMYLTNEQEENQLSTGLPLAYILNAADDPEGSPTSYGLVVANTNSDNVSAAIKAMHSGAGSALVAKNSGTGTAISVPQFGGATQLAYGFPATYNSETEVYTPRTNGSDCTIPNNVTVFNLPLADAAWNLTLPSYADAGKLLIIINRDDVAATVVSGADIAANATVIYVSTGSAWVRIN